MCAGTKDMGQDWGGKCTIDAKRLWKIFYITPGGGGSSANIRVSEVARDSWWDGWAVRTMLPAGTLSLLPIPSFALLPIPPVACRLCSRTCAS